MAGEGKKKEKGANVTAIAAEHRGHPQSARGGKGSTEEGPGGPDSAVRLDHEPVPRLVGPPWPQHARVRQVPRLPGREGAVPWWRRRSQVAAQLFCGHPCGTAEWEQGYEVVVSSHFL